MKRVLALIVLFSVGIAAFAAPASAVWSGWSGGGVTARVYIDASTYTQRATTIDWKVEKKGSQKLYYKAWIRKYASIGVMKAMSVSGSFKSSTPMKTFPVKKLRKEWGNGQYDVYVVMYTDSKMKKVKGVAISKKFYIVSNI